VPPITHEPKDLWTADFNGPFTTRDWIYCYPLTLAASTPSTSSPATARLPGMASGVSGIRVGLPEPRPAAGDSDSQRSTSAVKGSRFSFATPHHSREGGTNEYINGLLPQYLPKGESTAHLTQADCNCIARHLSRRPRRRLGYRTPEECYNPRT